MIKIATAECFTHGKIAREIHALSQRYDGELGYNYTIPFDTMSDLILVCGIFAPTVSALKNILKVEPPKPLKLIGEIKVYDGENDKKVAALMAKAVKDISNADIGIGTTAGIGRGGIAISTSSYTAVTTSGFYADLTSSCSSQILKRQKCGIEKALHLFSYILNDDLEELMEDEDIKILEH